MRKEVSFCDGCDKMLNYKNKEKISKIIIEGEEIYNGVDGYDKLTHELEFCPRCSKDIKDTLDLILKKLSS